MSIPSVAASSQAAFHSALDRLDASARRIGTADPFDPEHESAAYQLAKTAAKAAATIMHTGDEMLGTLLDMKA